MIGSARPDGTGFYWAKFKNCVEDDYAPVEVLELFDGTTAVYTLGTDYTYDVSDFIFRGKITPLSEEEVAGGR